ncbi:response regulator [bacterium]|nr:response regulator [bacterium]
MPKILIVEDEILVAQDIQRILEHFGYSISSAVSRTEDTLREIQKNRPDLVLMDIKLGDETNGIDITKRIQERFDIPIIYITALIDEKTFQRAKETDPYGYIYKPVEERELNAAVEMALYKHSMKKKMMESEQKYRQLFEMSQDAIYITRNEVIVDVNQAFLDLFRTTKEKILGESIKNMYSFPEDILKLKKEMEKKGFVKDYGIKLKRMDGKEMDCLTTTSFRKDKNGENIGMQGIIRDITEQRRAEKEKEKLRNQLIQSEKMAALGTMASGIAHEFNNLIQILRGHTEFAQQTKKEEHVNEAMDVVLKSSDRASDIVKDLLTYSRNETVEKEKVEVVDIVESVLSLVEEQLEKMNIKVEREYEKGSPVEVNKGEMQQVFLNIINNSRDSMFPEGGKLEIKIRRKEGNAEVSIRDTGSGIKKKEQRKLFEPFYTTKKDGREKKGLRGTGLGLSVSYAIVKRHQGDIEVESKVGKGSTFTVKIPVKRKKDRVETKKERKIKGEEEIGSLSILVVDDEEKICGMLEKWLNWEGHEVKTVDTGRKAVNQVEKKDFDMVFLDVVMPGLSGEETLFQIKEISPETKVVMMTGKLKDTNYLEKLEEASRYIQKPFTIKDIIDTLKQYSSM